MLYNLILQQRSDGVSKPAIKKGAITMAKNAHLTYDDRLTIQSSIADHLSFKAIGLILGKDPSTIAKEVKGHIKLEVKGSFNPCLHQKTCTHNRDICKPCSKKYSQNCRTCSEPCYKTCPDFEEKHCLLILKPPYVCNGCTERHGCKLQRHLYDAKYAQKEYEDVLSESRQGFAISEEELKRIDAIITPLVKQGQSIHHICIENADDIMLDEKTIYNYIDAGLLSVGNIDLPRKVRYRIRKKKKPVHVDKQCHVGRTYDDFQEFISANPDVAIVEMDSVEGRKGGKVFLTIYFRSCSLMLAFIRDHNTARSVTETFNSLYELLGHEVFTTLFPVILTDRGSEFTDPLSIEFNADGERRTHLFYCDPQRSDQKGGIEVTHEMIRRVLPKKTSFDNLTQEDVSLMMSHINSYKRKKLGNRSAHQLFSFLHDEGLLEKLGITLIPSKEINLTPLLLKK